ncbi:hypothetical protein CSV77_02610 [Sporosarcina sp. P16b]|uniref:type II secretion system protein n=1 Tax=Sporosarcina sp. P16b TaxID=2048261 RepID=UPI000C16DC40|nr:type II secretion system protein [Sporosarcina sp. P16b]PIC72119.1 hypothetical protein CSV77_02610 [Sporosarcina sp. P16b]
MPEAKRIFNCQYGFTFLELMLVLSIMMILTAVILPFSEKHLKKESEEDALKQFIAAVHEAQLYAMTHKGSVALTFSDSGAMYKVERMDRTVTLRSGIFPDGMRMTKQSPLKRLDFAETGYMVKTGKMYFSTQSSGLIFISFQFERGRMIVNE